MDISIIVPLYKGQQYIKPIQKMVSQNIEFALKHGKTLKVELLFVNDYPDETIKPDIVDQGYELAIITNSKNCGIHQTRVNGLNNAKGKFILFLDQDDEITPNCLYSQYLAIGNNDIVVGNGYRGINGDYRKIYRNKKKQELSGKEKYFVKAANQIISPGHCLIRKDAIPQEWNRYIITANGGDDLFLWILMFEKRNSFTINPDCVYRHVDTGINLSNDLDAMYNSSDNVIRSGRECGAISKTTLDDYERRIVFLKSIRSDSFACKLLSYVKNIDICLLKLYAYYR